MKCIRIKRALNDNGNDQKILTNKEMTLNMYEKNNNKEQEERSEQNPYSYLVKRIILIIYI